MEIKIKERIQVIEDSRGQVRNIRVNTRTLKSLNPL